MSGNEEFFYSDYFVIYMQANAGLDRDPDPAVIPQ